MRIVRHFYRKRYLTEEKKRNEYLNPIADKMFLGKYCLNRNKNLKIDKFAAPKRVMQTLMIKYLQNSNIE